MYSFNALKGEGEDTIDGDNEGDNEGDSGNNGNNGNNEGKV